MRQVDEWIGATDDTTVPRKKPVIIDALFDHCIPEPNTGCWLWLRAMSAGYGQVTVNGKARLAHRVSYELSNGPLSPGQVVCHKCDTPACINPDHLFAGTRSDNMRDCVNKGRAWSPSFKGERHHQARLTDSDIQEIRSSILSLAQIAVRYGISKSNAGYIRQRKNWRHLP